MTPRPHPAGCAGHLLPREKGSLCLPTSPDPRLSTGYGRGRSLLPRGEGGRRPDEGLRPRRQSARQAPRVVGARRAIATEGLEPGRKIDRIAAESAFGQHHGDFARDPRFASARGVDHHARETRRQRKARDRAAFIGDASVAVEGADLRQERARLLERGARGRIEKGKLRWIGDAPEGAIERETGKIGGENFRRGVGLKAAVRRLLPQPIANAWLRAPGAPASLIGVRPADADRFEPSEADVGLIDRNAHEPAVDDDAHALDRERRLGDRSGEHDLAPPRRRGGDGEILRAAIERAIERRDVDVGALDTRFQGLGDAADFALARQEDEDRAAFACERLERDARDLVLDAGARIATDISCLDGEGAALALDQRRITEQRAHARAVERRRHDKKPQILAQALLRVEREGEAEVGVERALVELVEQNGRHAIERGIVRGSCA